jgi:hypothetical protein
MVSARPCGHGALLATCLFSALLAGALACSSPSSSPVVQDAGLADGEPDGAPAENCFQLHLEEAIALNEKRKPLYSWLTQGRSDAISDKLIESEKVSLIFARTVDDAARPYQQAGVAVACDEFVSMADVPVFREQYAFEPEPLTAFEPVDGVALRDRLEASFADEGFAGLAASADAALHALEEPRAYHCMVRHMLESLRRIANLAPVHEADAHECGLASPLSISEDLVELHLLSIDPAARLDDQASVLQSEGIPILCQDVPSIPPGP